MFIKIFIAAQFWGAGFDWDTIIEAGMTSPGVTFRRGRSTECGGRNRMQRLKLGAVPDSIRSSTDPSTHTKGLKGATDRANS